MLYSFGILALVLVCLVLEMIFKERGAMNLSLILLIGIIGATLVSDINKVITLLTEIASKLP